VHARPPACAWSRGCGYPRAYETIDRTPQKVMRRTKCWKLAARVSAFEFPWRRPYPKYPVTPCSAQCTRSSVTGLTPVPHLYIVTSIHQVCFPFRPDLVPNSGGASRKNEVGRTHRRLWANRRLLGGSGAGRQRLGRHLRSIPGAGARWGGRRSHRGSWHGGVEHGGLKHCGCTAQRQRRR
jgi:hypothetical protein